MNAVARAALLAAACLALLASGCRSAKLVPVRGKVTLDGAPVREATIYFENEDGTISRRAGLDGDGNYEVKTYEGAGLPPGKYRVAVTPGRIMEPGETPLAGKESPKTKGAPAVPERYHTVQNSRLTAEVKAGESKPFDFELTK